MDVKANWNVCKSCLFLYKINKKDKTILKCTVENVYRDPKDAPTIGSLKGTDAETAPFTNRGSNYIPTDCPYFLEQSMLQIEREESENELSVKDNLETK